MPLLFQPVARRMSMLAVVLIAAVVTARPAASQTMMNAESTAEVRRLFVDDLDSLQAKYLALANAIPEDKYSWRPAPGVRSIGEAFMHIASEYYVYTPMAYGLAPSPVVARTPDALAKFEKASTRADAMKHLNEGFAFVRAQLLSADISKLTGKAKLFGGERTLAETSMIMSADLHEHLGQLIAYARMNGIKPPWSK